MKTIITASLSIILSLSAFANCRVDTTYLYEFDLGTSAKLLTGRKINYYNGSNQLIQIDDQNRDFPSATFVNRRRITNTLDASGNILRKQTFNWNASTSVWDNFLKQTYTYNAANLMLSRLSENWDASSGTWLLSLENTNTYSAADKILSYTQKSWEPGSGTWRVNRIVYYTYDASNNLTEEFGLEYDASLSSLANKYKNLNTYNAANLLTQQIKQIWETGIWVNDKRERYTYSSSGLLTDHITQIELGSVWTNSAKTTYNYTAFDSISFEETSNWLVLSYSWSPAVRIYNTYNGDKKLTENRGEVYASSSSSWVNSYKVTKEYNGSKDLVAEDQYVGWHASSGGYREHVRAEYVCSSSTGIGNVSAQPFLKIYPNPVTNHQLFIDSKTNQSFCLLNINGQAIEEGNLKIGTNTIDVKALSSGLYFIKIGNEAMKIIIQ